MPASHQGGNKQAMKLAEVEERMNKIGRAGREADSETVRQQGGKSWREGGRGGTVVQAGNRSSYPASLQILA